MDRSVQLQAKVNSVRRALSDVNGELAKLEAADAAPPAEPSPAEDAPASEPEPPKLPPGQCQKCGADVFRADIETDLGDRPPMHRVKTSKHDLKGDLCGPVATSWLYHVVYSDLDGRHRSGRVKLAMVMERGNAIEIAEMMLSRVLPGDTTSPRVAVLDWKLLWIS